MVSRSWRQHGQELTAFLDHPPEIRQVIYTTNAIESLNSSLRTIPRTRRAFPSDEAAIKLMYLALHNVAKRWTMPVRDWPNPAATTRRSPLRPSPPSTAPPSRWR